MRGRGWEVSANKRAWRATAWERRPGDPLDWMGIRGWGDHWGDFWHLYHRTVGPELGGGTEGLQVPLEVHVAPLGPHNRHKAHSLSLYWPLRLSVWGQVAGLLQGPPSFLAPLLTSPKCWSSPEFCCILSDLYPATCWAFPIAAVHFTGTCSRLTGSSLFCPALLWPLVAPVPVVSPAELCPSG